jgi:hypothetical protein
MRRQILLIATFSLIAVSLSASQAVYVVQDSALNKFAAAVGSFSGNAGKYEFAVWRPCFPDFWHSCRAVLYSNDVLWTLSNPSFSIGPGGITFSGALTGHYGPFSFATTVSGPVGLSYQAATSTLSMSITQINVPITINLPVFGSWTITTLQVNPNYSFSYGLTKLVLTVANPPTGTKFINASPTNVTFTYQPGAVAINTEFVVW